MNTLREPPAHPRLRTIWDRPDFQAWLTANPGSASPINEWLEANPARYFDA